MLSVESLQQYNLNNTLANAERVDVECIPFGCRCGKRTEFFSAYGWFACLGATWVYDDDGKPTLREPDGCGAIYHVRPCKACGSMSPISDLDAAWKCNTCRTPNQSNWNAGEMTRQFKDPILVCPHCHVKGNVHTSQVTVKEGISGAKATAAILTRGLSILATGLSDESAKTQAHCDNCGVTWLLN